ncbi:MAG: hypothetical protein EBY65_02165, partial [Acidimicrobiia bacterium]|nr:hypothetical protein [Acidimicrobiia bacterium]
ELRTRFPQARILYLSAEQFMYRFVRALREKDVTTLMRVPRVGRKKAEQIILDLADKIRAANLGLQSGLAPVAAMRRRGCRIA